MHDAEIDEARFLASRDDLDGEPSTSSARRRKGPEFFATRSAFVPTMRTASRGMPRKRSEKRFSAHIARCWARSRAACPR